MTDAGAAPSECVVSLDTEAYDIVDVIERGGPSLVVLYENAFGDDPAVWTQASPILQLDDGEPVPDYLLVTRGSPGRQAGTAAFGSQIQAGGGASQVVGADPYTHTEVNEQLGAPNESLVTAPVGAFIDSCTG